VWVLNESGAISELSAATGQLQQTISGSYCTTKTTAISDDGSNVWVTCQSDLVAEFSDATGKLVRTISGADSQLDDPIALSSDGQKVWVIDKGSGAITAYDATTGDLDISINQVADAVSSDGTHVWLSVVESMGLTRYGAHVVELEASNGSVVASIPTTSDAPVAIAADGAHTLVAECACDFEYNDFGYNDYGGVDEIDPTSSGEVELLGAPTNAINGPTSVVVAGGRAWITDQWGDSVTGFSLGW
jgi:DNA-binding beta-propeller fold protein YncE